MPDAVAGNLFFCAGLAVFVAVPLAAWGIDQRDRQDRTPPPPEEEFDDGYRPRRDE